MDRIDEIRERLSKATPGKWEVRAQLPYSEAMLLFVGREDGNRSLASGMWNAGPGLERDKNNFEMIAHAPSDLAYLLSQLDAARKVVEAGERLASWAISVKLRPGSNTPEFVAELLVRTQAFAIAHDEFAALDAAGKGE